MNLYHTSPVVITQVYTDQLFGTHIFFSDRIYVMTLGDYITYEIDIDEKEIINASSIFYIENSHIICKPVIEKVMKRFNVDQHTAMELIDESINLIDLSHKQDYDDCDDCYYIQKMTAKAAELLGYSAVAVTDETGISYMLDLKIYFEKMKIFTNFACR